MKREVLARLAVIGNRLPKKRGRVATLGDVIEYLVTLHDIEEVRQIAALEGGRR